MMHHRIADKALHRKLFFRCTAQLRIAFLLFTGSNTIPQASNQVFAFQQRNTSSSSSSSFASTNSFGYSSSSSSSNNGPRFFSTTNAMPENWSNESMRQEALQKCILPLSSKLHKGSSGRIGVLGGSARYTGAPYYAAMASLKAGADLAFVFCAQEAALPIKSYSPELMVAPVYNAGDFDQLVKNSKEKSDEAESVIAQMVEDVKSSMDKLHALIVGPGLGRCPIVLEAASRIIQEARSHKIPLVLDADALYLLTLEPYQKLFSDEIGVPVILTPNVVELKRLQGLDEHWSKDCVIVAKGNEDVIYRGNKEESKVVCNEKGGLKRPGGLGDLLAGTLGAFSAWNGILTQRKAASIDDMPLSCWMACCTVKRATGKAFDMHRRSMTAPDVLDVLGDVVNEMTFELDSKL